MRLSHPLGKLRVNNKPLHVVSQSYGNHAAYYLSRMSDGEKVCRSEGQSVSHYVIRRNYGYEEGYSKGQVKFLHTRELSY